MTTTAMNYVMAELCGWRYVDGDGWRGPNGETVASDCGLPDYVGCLDDVAEARRRLLVTDWLRLEFSSTLAVKCVQLGPPMFTDTYSLIDSDAATQCECILRVLGKWTDDDVVTQAGATCFEEVAP